MINIPFSTLIPANISLESAFGQDIIQMILHAGPVVRLVLLILLLFSVVSWTIIFMKYRVLSKAKTETSDFLELFWEDRDIKKVSAILGSNRFTAMMAMFMAASTLYSILNRDFLFFPIKSLIKPTTNRNSVNMNRMLLIR